MSSNMDQPTQIPSRVYDLSHIIGCRMMRSFVFVRSLKCILVSPSTIRLLIYQGHYRAPQARPFHQLVLPCVVMLPVQYGEIDIFDAQIFIYSDQSTNQACLWLMATNSLQRPPIEVHFYDITFYDHNVYVRCMFYVFMLHI